MKKLFYVGVAAILPLLSQAQVLVNDNFDGYANQAAFEAAWPVVGTLPSGVLSTAQAVSSPNSIYNAGTAVATSAMRNSLSFTESGTASALTTISFSFDFFDGNAAAQPYRSHSNLQDGTAPGSYGQLVAMGLNNNQVSTANGGNYYMGRILGYNPNETGATTVGSFFKLNDVGAPLRSDGWHNLAVVISDLDFKFYVDGILSETVVQAGTLRSYDHLRLGSGLSNAGVDSYFDNVRVEVSQVPEPGILSMVMLGAGALVAARRGRK
jgi:hypothetical protein